MRTTPIALLLAGCLNVLPGSGFANGSATDHVNRGIAASDRGDLDGAIANYDRALELNPKYTDAYNNRGTDKVKKGDLDDAIADFNRALELDPKLATAYHNRGLTKVIKGDLDGAITDCDRALELDPKYASAYSNRGCAKFYKGDLDGAIADYDRALELNPKSAATHYYRGAANYVKHNWTDALADFRRSSELSERSQDCRLLIWLVRARLGENAAADKEPEAYLEKRRNTAPGDWVSNVAGHLLGKVSEAELFAAAKSLQTEKERGQFGEAWFYAGMKKLLAGDKSAAACFEKCVAIGQKTFIEHQLAKAELTTLGQ